MIHYDRDLTNQKDSVYRPGNESPALVYFHCASAANNCISDQQAEKAWLEL